MNKHENKNKKPKNNGNEPSDVELRALELLGNPQFLFQAGQQIGKLGVMNELDTRLILTLAGIARVLPGPPSVLLKGSSSSGKSTLMRESVKLFPPECVIKRDGLSKKALAYGPDSLSGKILLISELKCSTDAAPFLRLIQSEGSIRHEATSVSGSRRTTETVERSGTPVVLSTTTDREIFEDSDTRFLTLWSDESPDQTLAILRAHASGPVNVDYSELPAWQTAMSLLKLEENYFQNPPAWLLYVSDRLPLEQIRVRRDWLRFLTFCSAIALCRAGQLQSGHSLDITFADYCVGYKIFEPVLAATLNGLRTQVVALAQTVEKLAKLSGQPVTVHEVAQALQWKEALVYKYAKEAAHHKLIDYEPGTREKNRKPLIPLRNTATD